LATVLVADIFATDPLFHPDPVATQLRPSTFQGRPVTRLSAELQLVKVKRHNTRQSKKSRLQDVVAMSSCDPLI
jgi:hypothetical protein